MLTETAPVGNNALLIAGPLVVALALLAWLTLTTLAARRRARTAAREPDETQDRDGAQTRDGARTRDENARGPVRGGVIEGDPGQRNRRT